MSATMMTDVSKYRCAGKPQRSASLGQRVTKALYPNATLVPTATRVFMFVPP
ncbi:hypothetical protein D3C83_275300 [compost metagenome]